MNIRDLATSDAVIQHVIQWAQVRADVRAVILTSSRTNPGAPVDRFSDYDLILAVTDVQPFFVDRTWLDDFGPVLVVYRDPLSCFYDSEKFAYITQYEDGLKIDFTLWPLEILRRVVADPVLPPDFDVGYIVLLDKEELTAGLRAPTYTAYIPTPPDVLTYHTAVEVFFHEATYVAKHLWRDDLIAAKYNLDYAMKYTCLRRLLEWRMEIDRGWSVKPGAYGRGLKRYVQPEVWAELEATYVGAGLEQNWAALFKTIALFRQVAIEVADRLGYHYPDDLHQRVLAYLQQVRRRDRQVE